MIINKTVILNLTTKTQDNLILIDKPVGWTSFDVVKKIKNIAGFNKVGHAGTLDPFASGLLILATGKETKNLDTWIMSDKEYIGVIEFGKQTDTDDVTGKTITQMEVSELAADRIIAIMNTFIGRGEQIPPMYSAKKVQGQRLYKLARKGREIERKKQKINIYELTLLSNNRAEISFYLRCSKGTYVRTLAHDIGVKSGYGAYLKELRRMAIDNFSVKEALSIPQFESYWRSIN